MTETKRNNFFCAYKWHTHTHTVAIIMCVLIQISGKKKTFYETQKKFISIFSLLFNQKNYFSTYIDIYILEKKSSNTLYIISTNERAILHNKQKLAFVVMSILFAIYIRQVFKL